MRIIEAIVIYRQNPGCQLILSGGVPKNEMISKAQMMANMALQLGVANKNIIIDERAINTKEEAQYIKETVQAEPFVLVTSASHMQRALMLFNKNNLFPTPAPVNFLILKEIPFSFMPSTIVLQSSEKALHEYLGILWAWITQQI